MTPADGRMPKVQPGTADPPALYGMDLVTATEELARAGVAYTVVRDDDPRGAAPGPDIVIATRSRGGALELVVGSTPAWPVGAP